MTGPSIVLPGLPTFNAGDPAFKIMLFDGWFGAAKPRSELVEGAGPGATAVGPWDFSEAYYTLSGMIRSSDRATLMAYRRALLAAFPANTESTVVVLGNGEDVDLLVDVRRYDAPTIDVSANNLTFTMPLVAVDPFKYGADLLSADMAAFNSSIWFQLFTIDTAPTPDEFYLAFDTSDDTLEMTQDTSAAALQAAALFSPGDETSRRVDITVTGPLAAGDWLVLHETTGRHLYADLALTADQSIEFDCYRQRAYLNGDPIDQHVFGDYLTLEPGSNTYRLVTGTTSAGSATVEARPAYQ